MNKTGFDNKLIRFNRKIISNKTKYLEVQKTLNSLTTKDYNFFSGRIYFTSNDVSQNTFVYQPTLDTLELKKKIKVLIIYTPFWDSIKLSGYRVGIKFDEHPLAVEQNNYVSKIVNVYIVCDSDVWPKILLRNFTIKNGLFGATNIVKNSDKEMYGYSGYGIAFDRKGEWSFDDTRWKSVIKKCLIKLLILILL